MTESAIGLPDRCDFTLLHCGRLLTWAGTGTSWQGKPGEGSETTRSRYKCKLCGSTVSVTVVEPDPPDLKVQP